MFKLKAALIVLVAALAAQTADAQRLSVSYGKRTNNGSFSIRLGTGGNYCPTPRRVWVPGHHRVEQRKVWVPGVVRKHWVQPVYRTQRVRDRYGAWRYEKVLVRGGHWQQVREPGYYEVRNVRVWVPGRYR